MVCEGCGCVFCPESYDEPSRQPVKYCSKGCKTNSRRRRARARGTRLPQYQQHKRARYRRSVCAEQGKTHYATEAAAREAVASLNAKGAVSLADVYPCGDQDHWHITSRRPATVRIVERGSDTPADWSDVKRQLGWRQPLKRW